MFALGRGRKGRLAGMVASVPLALGLVVAAATPAAAAPDTIQYVALGDSYTAGQGAGPEDPDCFRTDFGYPNIIENQSGGSIDLVENKACQGATTEDLRLKQLPSKPDGSVDLVTLTIGGHDAGFAQLSAVCGTNPSSTACKDLLTIDPAETKELLRKLKVTYHLVTVKYPEAEVVVVGYPRLFNEALTNPAVPGHEFYAAVILAGDALNAIIAQAAGEAGLTYVSVQDAFSGHEIGGPLEAWIWPSPDAPNRGYLHPNEQGYLGGYYVPLVAAGVVAG